MVFMFSLRRWRTEGDLGGGGVLVGGQVITQDEFQGCAVMPKNRIIFHSSRKQFENDASRSRVRESQQRPVNRCCPGIPHT